MAKDLRYLAVLCLGALGILFAGVLLRPEKAATPVPSESDMLQLQLSAQRRDFERRTLFFRSKARELARFVSDARSGIGNLRYRMPQTGDTVVLVGARDVWASAVTAGLLRTECGDIAIDEIGSTVAIPATLENAVAFDLDNSLAAFVISCDERRLLTTPEGFKAWTAERALDDQLVEHGLRVTRAGTELEVLAVGADSPLRRAGLREGDRIMDPATKAALLDAAELLIRRGERTRKLKMKVEPK
jgi:hypothetical protein